MRQKSAVRTAVVSSLPVTAIAWVLSVLLLTCLVSLAAHALTPISQSYNTKDKLVVGSLVSLQKDTTDQVVAAVSSNAANLLGVVIAADSSFIELSGGQANQVLVATGGTAQVLVSDINGEVVKGDFITPSPIAGIGMKATSNVRIVGTAQTDLTKSGGSKQTFKMKNGEQQSAFVGPVTAFINVSSYFREPEKTIIPSSIQNIANGLAGRNVSTLPILISGGIFIIMMIIVMSIIYSMIKNSIISIGRNPMSQSAVYRDLIQLSSLVLVILGVGLASIYFVLSRMG